ncbi:gem-associated protein 6-like [Euwallacea fornicatus]|uniref:gem-associated protein 6-like n=1 Tax=Euwallacea fornicatus TaxID=995702 RepID=UPI00338E19CB
MDLFEDKIFRNDPTYMKSLIGKTVHVRTIKNEVYTGVVYVIDPIYKTLVLHTKETSPDKHDTVLILYVAIQSLEVLSQPIKESYLTKERPRVITDETTREKQRLKKWLQKMYINTDEIGDYLKIDDNLLIMPPYGLDNCICSNTIVLEKIKNIMCLMPEEFE